jgi:DNA-binding NarL/FixJ family response regulator
MEKTRILVVDDHAVVREGLRALLAAEEDMEVVGEAQDGREGVALALQTRPEVVVMDLSMPVLNGLEATRRILKSLPKTRVLVLSSYQDAESVEKLIQSGAAGYLTKQSAAHDLCQAIREVRRGRPFWSDDVAKILRDKDRVEKLPGSSGPTEREIQVLQLIAEGFPNKGIAAKLGISIKTVEKHRQAVMNKLNIHEAAGLTRYAISKGILEKGPG